MALPGPGGVVGRAVWALAAFIPAAPFRLYPGRGDRPPFTVADIGHLRRAAQRGGDAELTVLTTVKLRPVLVVAEAEDSIEGPAVLALRLQRFSKLTPAEQSAVRGGDVPRLAYLRPDRFRGLPEENAAVLPALVRVARSALDESEDLGGLDVNELRVVHERIVGYFGFDLTVLVRRLLDHRLRKAGRQP